MGPSLKLNFLHLFHHPPTLFTLFAHKMAFLFCHGICITVWSFPSFFSPFSPSLHHPLHLTSHSAHFLTALFWFLSLFLSSLLRSYLCCGALFFFTIALSLSLSLSLPPFCPPFSALPVVLCLSSCVNSRLALDDAIRHRQLNISRFSPRVAGESDFLQSVINKVIAAKEVNHKGQGIHRLQSTHTSRTRLSTLILFFEVFPGELTDFIFKS